MLLFIKYGEFIGNRIVYCAVRLLSYWMSRVSPSFAAALSSLLCARSARGLGAWGLGCVCEVFAIVALPAAFAPGGIKTHSDGNNAYCQWSAKYIDKIFHLFLLFGFANLLGEDSFRRPVLSVFISFVVILRPKIKSTIAATTPPIKIISCGISLRKIPPITTLPIISLLKSSRYFPASSSRVVRFFGFFFIASSARILHGGGICFINYDKRNKKRKNSFLRHYRALDVATHAAYPPLVLPAEGEVEGLATNNVCWGGVRLAIAVGLRAIANTGLIPFPLKNGSLL